jgi:alcohol dehydrogenase class IV
MYSRLGLPAVQRKTAMRAFVYSALPGKVLFSFGTIDKVADEIRQLGCRRALVLSTPQQAPQAEHLAAILEALYSPEANPVIR